MVIICKPSVSSSRLLISANQRVAGSSPAEAAIKIKNGEAAQMVDGRKTVNLLHKKLRGSESLPPHKI